MKIFLSYVLGVILLYITALVLNWIFIALNGNTVFIFFVILVSAGIYTTKTKEIQRLHERILKLEGYDHENQK